MVEERWSPRLREAMTRRLAAEGETTDQQAIEESLDAFIGFLGQATLSEYKGQSTGDGGQAITFDDEEMARFIEGSLPEIDITVYGSSRAMSLEEMQKIIEENEAD